MSTEENKRIVRRFMESASAGDLAVVDALVAPDFVFHNPADPAVGTGPAGFRRWIAGQQEQMRDARLTIEDQIAEGDKVATRYTVRGTHVPTGKAATVTVIAIDELRGGQLVGHWDEADILGAMQQVGAIPAPGAAGETR